MANDDFTLNVGLELTPASLKAIQSDINNAIRQINPKLNLDLGEVEKFQRDGIRAIVAHIGGVDLESVAELRRQIEKALDVRINKIQPSARSKQELRRELEQAIAELEISVKKRDFGPSFGSAADEGVDTQKKNVEAAEARVGAALQAVAEAAEEERKQIEKRTGEATKAFIADRDARNKVIEARLREAQLIAQETADIQASETKKQNDEAVKVFVKERDARNKVIQERLSEAQLIAQETDDLHVKAFKSERDARNKVIEERLREARLIAQETAELQANDLKKRNDEVNKLWIADRDARNKVIAERLREAQLIAQENAELSASEEEKRNNEATKLFQKERDARNKVIAERLKEARLIAQETAELQANELAKTKKEQSKQLRQAIKEALDDNKVINETNRQIQQARERLASAINQQVAVGNIKPQDNTNSQKLLGKAIETAASGFGLLGRVIPAVGQALTSAKTKVETEFGQLKLADAKKSLEGLRKELDNQRKRFAAAIDELRLQKLANSTPDKKIEAEKALLKEIGESRLIRRQINSKEREVSRLAGDIEKTKRNALASERAAADASARDAKRASDTKNLKGLQGIGRVLESAQNKLESEFNNFKLSGAKKEAEELRKALNEQKNKVRAAAKELDLQKKALSTPDKIQEARLAMQKELGEHRLIQRNLNEKTREVSKIESDIVKTKRDQLAHEKALASVIAREAKRGGGQGSSGGSRNSKDLVFKGAGDIARFGRQLDPKSLERFVDILQDANNKTKTASQLQSTFATSIQRSTGFVSKIRDNLNSATKSAFQFGEQSTDAARRLLAWAGPATFIFSTISALKSATKQLVEIDSAARRLTFFENADFKPVSKGATNLDFGNFSKTIKDAESNIQLFIQTSSKMGVAINDVVEATLTASRVGQKLTQSVRDQNGEMTKAPSIFLDSILSLVRLEGGALKAEDAVNSLNAIDIQFFDKLKSDLAGAELEAFEKQLEVGLAGAASLLAVVAAKSAFSVRELADATARVGAAFANIQGTGLPQVITLIGEASSATGANVGRLSTALRQILTFSVQNAEAIKKNFNIDVIDAEGGVAGFQAVLQVLRKINELSGTEKAVDLAKLIGDRRNVADIQSLAVAVSTLEKQYGDLTDTQAEVLIIQSSVEQQLRQDVVAADSMQAATNRLNTEFVNLANNAGLGSFFKDITEGATSAVKLTSLLIDGLAEVKPLLAGIATFSLAAIAPKVGAGIAGFVSKAITSNSKEQAATAIQSEKNGITAINNAEKDGLLTKGQALLAREKMLFILEEEKILEIQIKKHEAALGNELRKNNVDLEKRKRLEAEIETLKKRQGIAERKNEAIRNTAQSNVLGASFSQQISRGVKIAAVGAAASTFVSFFGDAVAEHFIKDKGIARSVSSGLNSAIQGASIGAAIGSLFGPGLGTAIGAGIGAAAAGFFSAYTVLSGKALEEAEEAAGELEARRGGLLAGIAQRKISEKRKSLEQGGKDKRSKIQAEVNRLTERSLEINKQIEKSRNAKEIQELEAEGLRNEEERARTILALQEEELKVEKQKFAIAQKLNELRRSEQRFLTELVNLEKTFGALIGERSKIDLGLKFNKVRFQREVEALQQRAQALFEKREINAKLGATFTELSEITQEIADINEQIAQKRSEQFGQEISAQEQIVQLASRKAEEQISAWAEASKTVVSAFSDVANIQRELANNFFERGKAFSDILGARLQEVSGLLEDAGASIVDRLARQRDIQQRRLGSVQGAAGAALSRLRQGAATPFGSTAELRAAAERTAILIGEAGKRGHQKVFDEESKLINDRLAVIRTEAENTKNLFEIRLAQTKAEIDIRKRLASEEIAILKERQEAERALHKERIGQQEEFGGLILEGPEAFLEVAKDIGAARKFFKGIERLDQNAIENIIKRAQSARQSGNIQGLQSVLRGLEALQKFGRPSLVSGGTNNQLESIFKRAQAESAEVISRDLKRQQDEINQQTVIQQQIEFRERQQAALLEAEAALADAQLRITIASQNAAINQRDVMIKLMQESISEQRSSVSELIKLQKFALLTVNGIAAVNTQDPDVIQAFRDLAVKFQQAGEDATIRAERERRGVGSTVVENAGNTLAEALNNATNGVSGFNSQLSGVADIQNRMGQILNERFNPIATGASTTSVGGAGAADAIARIEEITRRATNGGVAIQRTKEFKELEAIIQRTGGSDAQRARFEELKKQEISPRNFGPGRSSDVARTLLRDPVVRSGLEDGFRGLLQSGAGGESDLTRQLREARGSGSRGARNIDPERVREILSRSGLSGLARDVDTRGEAVQVVDKLLRFSDELNRTPERMTERATGLLREILSVELKEGFREVAQVLQNQRNPISQEALAAGEARGTGLDIFNQNATTEFTKEFARRFNEAFNAEYTRNAEMFLNAFQTRFEAVATASAIKVDLPKLNVELKANVTNTLEGEEFLNEFNDVLTRNGLSRELTSELYDKVIKLTSVMVNTGQIQPDFGQ